MYSCQLHSRSIGTKKKGPNSPLENFSGLSMVAYAVHGLAFCLYRRRTHARACVHRSAHPPVMSGKKNTLDDRSSMTLLAGLHPPSAPLRFAGLGKSRLCCKEDPRFDRALYAASYFGQFSSPHRDAGRCRHREILSLVVLYVGQVFLISSMS